MGTRWQSLGACGAQDRFSWERLEEWRSANGSNETGVDARSAEQWIGALTRLRSRACSILRSTLRTMRLLLGTHISLWLISDPALLTPAERAAIDDPETELLLSAV